MRILKILLAAMVCFSFKPNTASLTEIRQVFDKLNTVPASAKEAAYLHYTVTSIAAGKETNEKPVISTADFELYASLKQNRVYSKEMVLLKDQANTFAILPSRKMIYISDAVTGKKNETLYSKLKTLQDTIFKNAEDITCQQTEQQAYNKIIRISLNKKMAGYLGIKRITYYINTNDDVLKRVFVEYQEHKTFISLDYVFHQTEFNSKKADMSVPVKKLVFESDKQLLTLYKDFKVIDNRKK